MLFINDIVIAGKSVFIRCDFNVPIDQDGQVNDDRRIREALPTIRYAVDERAKVILASHLGRPNGYDKSLSLKNICRRLETLLHTNIILAPDCVGEAVEEIIKKMKPGEIVLLENLRFHKGETQNDSAFAQSLAKLAQIYVNNAFGTSHRRHASIFGMPKIMDVAAAGFLLKKEISYFKKVLNNPIRPLVSILGGAKLKDKIGAIKNLLELSDKILIGGKMAFPFIVGLGKDLEIKYDDEITEIVKEILFALKTSKKRFYLPVDVVAADSITNSTAIKIVPIEEIPKGWYGVDIGPATVKLFGEALADARTILWNGPMGIYENDLFSRGTSSIAHYVADSYALTVVGGGDTADAIYRAQEDENMSFVSTGGGAALRLISGKELPGLAGFEEKQNA